MRCPIYHDTPKIMRVKCLMCGYHLQSVFNGMHVIFIPYSLLKIDPGSWMKMVTRFKGET